MTTRRSTLHPTPPMDDAVVQSLQIDLVPVDPPEARATLLRERVLAVARASGADRADYCTIPADVGAWARIAPKVEMKVLQDSPSCKTVLYRFQAGGVLPAHHHPGEEECIVLEGEARMGEIHVQRGDYHLAHANTDHPEVWSPTGAVLYVRHSRCSTP
ncbi:MAG: cupin domain-containing protein [Betaproteobacteria bacterium]